MSKILIIAQNPKTEFNIMVPMLGTRSFETLNGWLMDAGIDMREVTIVNSVNKVGKINNKDLLDSANVSRISSYLLSSDLRAVVTLGRPAAYLMDSLWLLSRHGLIVLNLPHPSGLNRKLNDPLERIRIVEQLKQLWKEIV